jgi:hypothetical protein
MLLLKFVPSKPVLPLPSHRQVLRTISQAWCHKPDMAPAQACSLLAQPHATDSIAAYPFCGCMHSCHQAGVTLCARPCAKQCYSLSTRAATTLVKPVLSLPVLKTLPS